MENRVVDTNLWFSICWVFVLTRLWVVLQASLPHGCSEAEKGVLGSIRHEGVLVPGFRALIS